MEKLLTVEEVSETLGLTKNTLWSYVRKGLLKSVKFGGRYRFEMSDVEEFIKNHKGE